MSIFFDSTTRMGVNMYKKLTFIMLSVICLISIITNYYQYRAIQRATLRIKVLDIMILDRNKIILKQSKEIKHLQEHPKVAYIPQLIAGKEGTIAARLNNPLNVKRQWNGKPWKGQLGWDKYNHIHFKDLEYGIRAASHILKTYYYKHKINTVEGIITRYCGYNKKYINYVSKRIGVKPTQKINIIKHIPELLKAMTRYECGKELPEKVFVTLDLVKEL